MWSSWEAIFEATHCIFSVISSPHPFPRPSQGLGDSLCPTISPFSHHHVNLYTAFATMQILAKPPNEPTYLLSTLPTGTKKTDYNFQDITWYHIIFLFENGHWLPNSSSISKDFSQSNSITVPVTIFFSFPVTLPSNHTGILIVPRSQPANLPFHGFVCCSPPLNILPLLSSYLNSPPNFMTQLKSVSFLKL